MQLINIISRLTGIIKNKNKNNIFVGIGRARTALIGDFIVIGGLYINLDTDKTTTECIL